MGGSKYADSVTPPSPAKSFYSGMPEVEGLPQVMDHSVLTARQQPMSGPVDLTPMGGFEHTNYHSNLAKRVTRSDNPVDRTPFGRVLPQDGSYSVDPAGIRKTVLPGPRDSTPMGAGAGYTGQGSGAGFHVSTDPIKTVYNRTPVENFYADATGLVDTTPMGIGASSSSPYFMKGTDIIDNATTLPAASAPTPGPRVKKNNTQTSNNPAAGSKVGSDKAADIPGYQNMMSGGATLLTAGAGGVIGGVTSYATGGEFFQGAAAGSIIGAGGVAVGMGVMNANKALIAKHAPSINEVTSAITTTQRRNAMFAGAGLSGMVFGGDRRSHRRGFNQSRGNTF